MKIHFEKTKHFRQKEVYRQSVQATVLNVDRHGGMKVITISTFIYVFAVELSVTGAVTFSPSQNILSLSRNHLQRSDAKCSAFLFHNRSSFRFMRRGKTSDADGPGVEQSKLEPMPEVTGTNDHSESKRLPTTSVNPHASPPAHDTNFQSSMTDSDHHDSHGKYHRAVHQAEHRAKEKAAFGIAEHVADQVSKVAEKGIFGAFKGTGERMVERAGQRTGGEMAEKMGERLGERALEGAGERIMERAAKRQGQEAVAKAGEHLADRALEGTGGGLFRRSMNKAGTEALEKAGERGAERALEGSGRGLFRRSMNKAGTEAIAGAGERVVERGAERALEQTGGKLFQRSMNKAGTEALEKVGERAAERGAERALNQAGKHAGQGAAARLLDRSGESIGERIVERQGEKVLERTVERSGEKLVVRMAEGGAERMVIRMTKGLMIALPAVGGLFALYLLKHDIERLKEEWQHKIKSSLLMFAGATAADFIDMCLHFFLFAGLLAHWSHHRLVVAEKFSLGCAIVSTLCAVFGEIVSLKVRKQNAKLEAAKR